MLLLGINEYLGIEIIDLSFDEIHLLFLAIAAAISVNIAKYTCIYYMAKDSLRKQKRNYNSQIIPFWVHFKNGEAVYWASLLIVLLETFFAAPGLISLLSPSIARNSVFQITVFAACGLFAFINLLLAFGTASSSLDCDQKNQALEEKYLDDCVTWEQEKQETEKKIILNFDRVKEEEKTLQAKITAAACELAEAEAKLADIDQLITVEEALIQEARRELKYAFQIFEEKVDDFLYVNPDLLQKAMEQQEHLFLVEEKKDDFSFNYAINELRRQMVLIDLQLKEVSEKINNLSNQNHYWSWVSNNSNHKPFKPLLSPKLDLE